MVHAAGGERWGGLGREYGRRGVQTARAKKMKLNARVSRKTRQGGPGGRYCIEAGRKWVGISQRGNSPIPIGLSYGDTGNRLSCFASTIQLFSCCSISQSICSCSPAWDSRLLQSVPLRHSTTIHPLIANTLEHRKSTANGTIRGPPANPEESPRGID